MKDFRYAAPESYAAAAALLARHPLALPKAGGTDLLDLLKERVIEPPELVSLGRVAAPALPAGAIAASRTLASLAADLGLAKRAPALTQAAAEAATPQIRNQGTLGGNLCQVSRCAYLRTAHPCLRLGDSECAAARPGAHTRYHGIFPAGGCLSAHSSSLAPALIALDATLIVQGPEQTRTLPISELYAQPEPGRLGDTSLGQDELVIGALIAATPLNARSTYLEVRERQSFDFALVSLAAAASFDAEGKLSDLRLVAGGVAPTPRRLTRAEAALRGKPLSEASLAAAAAAAAQGAQPTADNRHKTVLLGRLIARALRSLAPSAGADSQGEKPGRDK